MAMQGQPTPAAWGNESLPDGVGADERWPLHAARIYGTLGAAGENRAPHAHRHVTA